MFQKCGLGPNAICEMAMSYMRERRRKEKDSCVNYHLQVTVVGIQRVLNQALMTLPQVIKVLWKKRDRNIPIIFTPVSISRCK